MPHPTVDIRDPNTGSQATISPHRGFNCFDFKAVVGDQTVDVLWSAPDFAEGMARPSSSGIPILFPFPGRLKGTLLTWEGENYQLDKGDGRGNAIHGLVYNQPWRIVEQTEQSITGEFQASVDEPQILHKWPADFRIQATYEISGSELSGRYTMSNPSDRPLPMGFGTHPYFRLPLGGESADPCQIIVPYTFEWEFENQLASGNQTPRVGSPTEALIYGNLELDHGYGGIQCEGDQCAMRIADPDSGRSVTQIVDATLSNVVMYTPGHRQAICIEPLTCIPDSFQLREAGIDGGLRVLEPGESYTTTIKFVVS